MGKRRKRLTMPKYAKKYASIIAHINKLKGNVTEVAEEVVEVVEEIKERLPIGLRTIVEPSVETNIEPEPAEESTLGLKEEVVLEKPKPRKPRRSATAKPKAKRTRKPKAKVED